MIVIKEVLSCLRSVWRLGDVELEGTVWGMIPRAVPVSQDRIWEQKQK